ncbi:HPr family phosphocarrier protein [Salipaludibacillus aurantiacus]|uniref:Phosphocarrier protein n=1 Tax=Salipaludibacillus aurantiacus TaxID=1601833 RepID=A0A1H9UBE9_9BACI|nr:HPr family phosphocarrier protein [Salipaludibacillus aurantiacus]SES06484.1 phosphocarrier protein [Salipaludibacillus aurantiacus]
MEHKKDIVINLSEKQTIIELSQLLTPFKAEVYIINRSGGNVVEANVKSLLGLVSLQIKNGDVVTVRAKGSDAEEALDKVIQYFS